MRDGEFPIPQPYSKSVWKGASHKSFKKLLFPLTAVILGHDTGDLGVGGKGERPSA